MEPKKIKSVKKREKPSFKDFNSRLLAIKENRDGKRDPANDAFKHIKLGFREKVEDSHVEDLCKYLFAWALFPRLALRIALEFSSRRSNALIEKLFRKIKIEMARRSKFPQDINIPLSAVSSSYERQKGLLDWIKANRKEGIIDSEWSRYAVVCLINNPMTKDDFNALHALVESRCRKQKAVDVKKVSLDSGTGKDNQYSSYLRLVAPLFISEKPALSKINFGIAMADVFKRQADRLETEKRELTDIQTSMKYELGKCRSLIEEKDVSIKELSEALEKMQKVIESKNKSLEEEAERFTTLDKHWQEKSAHEIARQAQNFKKYFSFEIREAELSLNSDNPNVSMALNRIKHMEEYLKQMENADER